MGLICVRRHVIHDALALMALSAVRIAASVQVVGKMNCLVDNKTFTN
jgi:hypothetical protein